MKKIILFIVICTAPVCLPQSKGLQNISHEILPDGNVRITYDLIEDSTAEYTVGIFLKKDDKASVGIKLMMLSGDCGTGKFAGKGRKILWYKSVEYETDFEAAGYYIELEVTKIAEPSFFSKYWYYLAGGAGAAIAVAIIAASGKDDTSAQKKELIDPPVRP